MNELPTDIEQTFGPNKKISLKKATLKENNNSQSHYFLHKDG